MVNSPVLRVHQHDVVSAWETRESRQLNLADMRFKRKMFEDWLWFVVFSSSHGSTWEKNRKDSRFSNDYCRFSEGNPRPWTLSMRRNNDPDKLQKKETARKRAPWLAMAVVSGFGPPGFWLGIIGKMSSSGPVMRLTRFCDTLIFKFSQSSFRQKSGTWLGMTNGLCLASAQMWCTSLPISTYISRNGCTGALTVQQACLQQICDTYTLYLEPCHTLGNEMFQTPIS